MAITQKKIHDETKLQIEAYQGRITVAESEYNRIKTVVENRDVELECLTQELNMVKA